MHKVKGTESIRGMLDLPKIGLQVKNEDVYVVKDEDYLSSDIQIALKMGFLTDEGCIKKQDGDIEVDGQTEDRRIRCRNIHKRSLTMPILSTDVEPGREFILKESQLLNKDVKSAINKNYIKIEGVVTGEDYSEAFLKIGELYDEKNVKTLEKKKEEVEGFEKEIEVTFKDEQKPEALETNEELEIPNTVIDVENPEPISAKNIPDPRKKSVVWNPGKEEVIKQMKGAVIGYPEAKPNKEEKEDNIDKLLFVDEELEKERIASHPILKDKEIEQNTELDFI